MGSPPTVDIDALLLPIPGASPAGESLRYAGTYDAIREARRAEDMLAQGDWKRDVKTADWPAVVSLAVEALTTKSKDLQIGVWLTEALVKLHGFAGLRDGFRVLRALHEQYWGPLHPLIEEDDPEPRLGPLDWLNEKLPPIAKAVAVTRSRDGVTYSWLQWEESRLVESLSRQSAEARAEALAEGKLSGEQFDKAVASTPRAFYESLFVDLTEAWEEFLGLERVVDEKFGRQAPSLLDLKKSLEDCQSLVEGITKKKRQLEPDPVVASSLRSAGRQAVAQAPDRGDEPITLVPQDREDALLRLKAVAVFFRQTEPHSPVSYLVQRAAHWGEMPLEEWLREVINDDGVLARVRETLGIGLQGSTPSEQESTESK